MIDLNTEFGTRVARRLDQEIVIWLTTVRVDGTPQPSPVWFWWDGTTVLIYSRPHTPKLRNIADRPRVALNFNSDNQGGDVVVFSGDALIDPNAPPADQLSPYLDKYRGGLKDIGMTPSEFAQEYSVAIRVTPTHLRGF